jgi:hypothetical protein
MWRSTIFFLQHGPPIRLIIFDTWIKVCTLIPVIPTDGLISGCCLDSSFNVLTIGKKKNN